MAAGITSPGLRSPDGWGLVEQLVGAIGAVVGLTPHLLPHLGPWLVPP